MRAFTRCAVVLSVGLIASFAVLASIRGSEPLTMCSCNCERRGDWAVAESTNFSIWGRGDLDRSRDLALRCEKLRDRLISNWAEGEPVPAWTPRCHVVVHDTRADYRHALTVDDESAGCTTVTCDQRQIIFRRIDLRSDLADWQGNALPHELTHVVLADQFLDCKVPAWLNEGLAMLAESEDLQSQRLTLLQRAHELGRLPEISKIVDGSERPQRDRNLGCASSLSLVQFLEQHGDRRRLVQFARQVRPDSHDQSLRDLFSMEGGLAELEQRWHTSLESRAKVAMPALAER